MQEELVRPRWPQIIDYDCYRKYLADFYEYKKSQRAGFSYRKFSALCGLKSPNYLLLVIKGERNLSEEIGFAVADTCGLSRYEKDYFLSLVRQENAKTEEELRRAYKEGLAAIRKLKTRHIPSVHAQILKNWQPLLIRELVFLDDFEPTPEYVISRLGNIITPQDAEKTIQQLLQFGYIIEKSGQWEAADPVIDADDNMFTDDEVIHYHKSLLKMWSQNMETYPQELREMGALNIPIDSAKIPEFKKRIQEFQDEIIGWVQDEKNADRVVQLGTYLIPVSFKD